MRLVIMTTSLVVLLGFAFGETSQMNQIFSKGLRLIVEVPRVHVDTLVTPKVRILIPAQVQSKRAGTVTLACVITGLQSDAVRITWKIIGATGLRKHTSKPHIQREPGGTFSAVGLYAVLAHQWNRGNIYRCDVTYEGFHYSKTESSLCNPAESF